MLRTIIRRNEVHDGRRHPTAAASGNTASRSSATSIGSQSPEYTHRERGFSFASNSGSSGHGAQYAAPAPTTLQSYGPSPPAGRGAGAASYGSTPEGYNILSQFSGLNIGGSNVQSPPLHHYQAAQGQGLQLGTSPRAQGWSQVHQPRAAPPSVHSASNSQSAPAGPSAQRGGHPSLPVPRRDFQPTPGDYEKLDPRKYDCHRPALKTYLKFHRI